MAIKFNGNNISAHSTFKVATASAAGGSGLVPAPAAGENTEYLRGDGTWENPVSGLFKTTVVTLDTLTIPAGESMGITEVLNDSNYTPIAVVGMNANAAVLNRFTISGSNLTIGVTNVGTGNLSVTPKVTILWVRNGSI